MKPSFLCFCTAEVQCGHSASLLPTGGRAFWNAFVMMVLEPCEATRNHRTVCLKRVNLWHVNCVDNELISKYASSTPQEMDIGQYGWLPLRAILCFCDRNLRHFNLPYVCQCLHLV